MSKEPTPPIEQSWEQLLDSVSTGTDHPTDTCWDIYHYLKSHHTTMTSVLTRTLLVAYIKLSERKPQLINSCMLGMAVRISALHADFQLPNFLKAWGYDHCLRDEDRQRQTGKDGRQYLSLQERVERAMQSYLLHHADERHAQPLDGAGSAIVTMYAQAVIDKEVNGRRHRFVKLVSASGDSFVADSHQFPCRLGEIQGRLFDVLTRVSRQGSERAAEIVASGKRMDEVFPVTVGYLDGIDDKHGHLHLYDPLSRHFVADKAATAAWAASQGRAIGRGSLVRFCPVIVKGDSFKRAVIVDTLPHDAGCEAFGLYDARLTYVNVHEGYARYAIQSAIPTTPEGVIAKEGFASLGTMAEAMRAQVAVGQRVSLLLFLKRGKDGVKHNHVAEMF